MAVDALVPDDPRVEHKFTTIGDLTYHYMLAKPAGTPVATIVLLHGWPDLAMGWRNQVPYLLSLNLQVVVPDMLGYGQTSAPESFEEYTMKKISGHIATIIKEVTDQPVILGGHDWGGWTAWRVTLYHPELIRAVFSICVPYRPPSPVKYSLEQVVERMPNFRYQLQFASPVAENISKKSPEHLRGVLNCAFGGTTPEGEPGWSAAVGIIEENVEKVRRSPLFSEEMMDYYVREFSRHGFHGPFNWYRMRDLDYDDEIAYTKDHPGFQFKLPVMLVMAERDSALPLEMAKGQEAHFAGDFNMEVAVGANHWVLLEKTEECNKFIGDFIKRVLGDDFKAAL